MDSADGVSIVFTDAALRTSGTVGDPSIRVMKRA
jgi:hypothetical protein